MNEEKHFPCWSKVDDNELEEAYEGAMEIEDGDKANLNAESISEASSVESKEKAEEEKLYSEADMKNAQDLF